MMGDRQVDRGSLFYEFSLERQPVVALPPRHADAGALGGSSTALRWLFCAGYVQLYSAETDGTRPAVERDVAPQPVYGRYVT
jgi:hypothetical protein